MIIEIEMVIRKFAIVASGRDSAMLGVAFAARGVVFGVVFGL